MTERGPYQYLADSVQEETMALLPKADRILDIGGGRGRTASLAKQRVGASFACVADISEEAIAVSQEGVDASVVCDIEESSSIEKVFADFGPFDLVLCLDVLEHLVDPWRVVHRIHEALEPGGHILASIPNVQNYRIILRALTGTWRYKESGLFDRTHLRFFGKASAIELMTCSGLRVAALGRAYGPNLWDLLLDKMSLGLLGPWVAMQNLILVQKCAEPERNPGFCGSTVRA